MEERRVVDYFVVAGLPPDPVPLEEFSNEAVLKPTHRQDPIVDLAIINRSLGEEPPLNFRCIEFTPTGHPADLNHGSIRAPEMYMCFRRGRDKPPLVDIGVLYEGKERVLHGCEVIYLTPHGRSANVNNSGNTRIYVTYRRADPKAASDVLAVMDVCVVLANKSEDPPHTFCRINKNLNKGMMGSDVFLCYKKSMAKTNFLTYKPAILGRYPLENLPGFDLPDRVAMFCLPLGAVIESWPSDAYHPSPVFSTFVLTAAASDGDRVYGAAVTFYETMDGGLLNESQREQLLLDELQSSNYVIAQNKSLCLLSRSPFFSTFKQFLVYLYKMSRSTSPPHSAPIERYIAHFLSEVPYPAPHRPRILIQLETSAITLCQPEETPLPRSGASFVELLKNLGPSNCVSLLLYTLLEQKLLIHSLRPAVLTSVAEAISSMIFPFHWQCPYIPLCPLSLSYVLNSPTPFIVGVDSRYFDLFDPPHDVTCVDLDTNTLTLPYDERKGHSIKQLHLPKKAAKVLKMTLERLFEQLCRESASSTSCDMWLDNSPPIDHDFKIWKRELQMETAIQEAFLRFMAVILKGYNSYLSPITAAPTVAATDVSSLFDIHGFLKSRDKAYTKFYSQLMKMQAFSRFIEERSFVSDKDSSLAFFDECLDKVDELKDEPRLIELEGSLQSSERTALVMPPEPVDLPPGAEYSYNGFPELNLELFPHVETPASASAIKPLAAFSVLGSQSCPYSPMTRRTKLEIKSAQKLAGKHVNTPSLWAKCLLWHCFSLWFIHLPAYIKSVPSKTKALRNGLNVLVKMQGVRLQPPDEVCYRVLMQLCGLYHQPALAVKVLFEMKRQGVEPNAITYGFYNKAVLESRWPTGTSATGYQLWMKLRNVVHAVAQFRTGLTEHHLRRQSVYSSETESYTDDGQSVDSYMGTTALENVSCTVVKSTSSTILINSGLRLSGNDTVTGAHVAQTISESSKQGANEELASTGGMSDRGYNSMTLEDANHISMAIRSVNLTDSDASASNVCTMEKSTATTLSEDTVMSDSSDDVSRPDAFAIKSDDTQPSSTSENLKKEHTSLSKNSETMPETINIPVSVVDRVDGDIDFINVINSCVDDDEKTEYDHSSSVEQLSVSEDQETSQLVTRLLTSPLNSPVHAVRTLVTQNDPLGLFNGPIQSVQAEAVHRDAQPSPMTKDRANSTAVLSEHSFGVEVAVRKSSSLDRLPALDVHADGSAKERNSVARSEREENKSSPVAFRPVSASPRNSSFGGSVRSAASLFASKYWTIRQSVVPIRTNSLGESPVNGDESCHEDQVSSAPVTLGNTESASSQSSRQVTAETNVAKSHLRVPPALYSPLVTSVLGGLKSLQSNEMLLGIKNSFETMTQSVRDTLADSWVDEEYEEADRLASGSGELEREHSCNHLNGNLSEETVKSERTETDRSSLQSNNDEAPSGHLIPVNNHSTTSVASADDGCDRATSATLGEGGSISSIPQSVSCTCESRSHQLATGSRTVLCPVEVEMCSLSQCRSCDNLLYDEEIMAGWTADDSNLNTSCQFCGSKLVPFLQINIKDYRHMIHPALTSLSQSMESMLSVQSAVGVQSPAIIQQRMDSDSMLLSDSALMSNTTAPSCDSGVETGGITEVPEFGNGEARESDDGNVTIGKVLESSHVDLDAVDSVNCEKSMTPSQVLGSADLLHSVQTEQAVEQNSDIDSKLCSSKVTQPTVVISIERPTVGSKRDSITESRQSELSKRRWVSTDLLPNVNTADPVSCHGDTSGGKLDSRRWTSEFSLSTAVVSRDLSSDVTHGSDAETKVDDVSSIISDASNVKNGYSMRRCVSLDPISVPYLSPLVLRKELENVLDQDGDLCLSRPEFIDQHPIVYWNMVWYFHRLGVPSHLPGFILTSKTVNRNAMPSNVWTSNDSRYVGLHCNWDNTDLHGDHGRPMYTMWNKCGLHSTANQSFPYPAVTKSVMQSILSSIKSNDVVSPLRLMLNERAKQRADYGRTRFHSIYRDILFLSFAALGRDCIDHDAFDREFKSMYEELPSYEKARMRLADRAPNPAAVCFRRLFGELEL